LEYEEMIATKGCLMIAVFIAVFVGIIAIANLNCFFFVEQNQWLKSPDVHYDWWHFIFFWDNAYSWLWFNNRSGWFIITVVWALILAVVVEIFVGGSLR